MPPTATAAPTKSLAKFAPGFDPQEIALKYATGTPAYSKFGGDQVLYMLTDNRRWYCDLIVAQKIERMRLQPGELFSVCKTEKREGNRRIEEVEITAVVEPPKEPAASVQMQTAGIHNENTTRSNGNTAQSPAPALPALPMNGAAGTTSTCLSQIGCTASICQI